MKIQFFAPSWKISIMSARKGKDKVIARFGYRHLKSFCTIFRF